MLLLERAWPWLRKRLEDMLDLDPQMVESEGGILLLLAPEVVDRVQGVGVSRIVS